MRLYNPRVYPDETLHPLAFRAVTLLSHVG